MVIKVKGIGGFWMMEGVMMIGNVVGRYDMERVIEEGDIVRENKI